MMKTLLLLTVVAFSGIYGFRNSNELDRNLDSSSSLVSRNALDWTGTYLGTIPCADCNGIETILILHKDQTYSLSSIYRGKSTEPVLREGKFTLNPEGNTITLSGDPDEKYPTLYLVEENKVTLLDKKGKIITGRSAGNYILTKNTSEITGKYWRLIELNGKSAIINGKQSEINLVFRSSDKRVTGYAGCNSFAGNYLALPGNRISFSELALTQKACENMELEAELLRMLENTDNYFSSPDTLVLNKAKMAPLAKFVFVYFR
jgi:heat shock protein HslJ